MNTEARAREVAISVVHNRRGLAAAAPMRVQIPRWHQQLVRLRANLIHRRLRSMSAADVDGDAAKLAATVERELASFLETVEDDPSGRVRDVEVSCRRIISELAALRVEACGLSRHRPVHLPEVQVEPTAGQ